MTAFELLMKAQKELEKMGFEMCGPGATVTCQCFSTKYAEKVGERHIYGHTVYRSNGTAENVSIRLVVLEVSKVDPRFHYVAFGKDQLDVRIRTDASEKVFTNRLKKVIDYYKR